VTPSIHVRDPVTRVRTRRRCLLNHCPWNPAQLNLTPLFRHDSEQNDESDKDRQMRKVIFQDLAPLCALVLVIAAATVMAGCDIVQSKDSNVIEINWIVLRSDAVLNDPYAGRQLKMRIPKDYVRELYRDPKGEGEEIKGVKNNGIEIVTLEAWLPDMAPQPPVADMKSISEEVKRSLFSRQLTINLKAGMRGRGPSNLKEQFVSQGKKGMVYRLPDLYGFERFRRMGCSSNSGFDPAKYDVPREAPPDGCWNLPADEELIGKHGDLSVWLTCAGRGGRCILRTHFQEFWTMQVIFPYSRLESWKEVKHQVENLLGMFITN
jgi:hypothetical protein